MHLVDDVDLVSAEGGQQVDAVADVADVVHAVLDAASISTMSTEPSSAMARQDSHSPQGSAPCRFWQLTARANIFARLVLPVPRGPENRYACAILPFSISPDSTRVIGS